MKKVAKIFLIVILIIALCVAGYFAYDYYKENISIDEILASVDLAGLEDIIGTGELVSDSEASALKNSASDIDTSSYSFDTTYKPYYGMLDSSEKNLYKLVYASAMDLSDSLIVSDDISVDEMQDVIKAIYNDNPELFWLENSYSYKYTSSNIVVQINLSYYFTESTLSSAKTKFENVANTIIEGAEDLDSNYEKEKYVHYYLIDLVEYDENSSMNQSAYSALVNKSTVCAGYARAFQYIMYNLDIPTYYVTGYSGEDHAWNIVYLSGGYYNVDVTWDDASSNHYTYFNKTDSSFSGTHTRTGLSVNLPKCTATKYSNLENTSSSTTQNNTTSTNTNNTTSTNSTEKNNTTNQSKNTNSSTTNSNATNSNVNNSNTTESGTNSDEENSPQENEVQNTTSSDSVDSSSTSSNSTGIRSQFGTSEIEFPESITNSGEISRKTN